MRLSTRLHGFFDLGIGLILIATPWVLGFGPDGPAGWSAIAVGIALVVNALLTDFEVGRVRSIPIPIHLWIDAGLGLLLAASPWLLEFDREAWIPHLAVGILLLLVAAVTRTIPSYDRRGSSATAAG